MFVNVQASSSTKAESNGSDDGSVAELTTEETQCVSQLKRWLQTEAKFNGRTDENFLLIYLRGTKFNVDKAKKKIQMFYENPMTFPKWWANRDLRDSELIALANAKVTTVLMDRNPHHPTVAITQLSRMNPHVNRFDDYVKLHSIIMQLVVNRRNCQLNGAMWIMDLKDYPTWVATSILNPTVPISILNSFFNSTAVKVKCIHGIHSPIIASATWALLRPFMPTKLQQKVYLHRGDRSTLSEHLPFELLQLLPNEYGGQAGPLQVHDDAFLKEIMSFSNYIAEDNKYGYNKP